MRPTIGFLGLGNMGHAMAERLLLAGFPVRVWNRTMAKAAPLKAKGATVVERPEDAAEPGGLAITMVSDDHALSQLAGAGSPLVARLGKGGLHLSMSTVGVATARTLAGEHAAAGVTYVAAPVVGRPDAAAAGKLWVLLAGSPAGKTRVKDAVAAMGQGSFDFGDAPEAANTAKLVVNFTLLSAMEAMAEGFTLGAKSGLRPEQLAELLGSTVFDCPAYKGYGPRLAKGPFEPAGFRLALGLKDVSLVLTAAAEAKAPMPLASLLRDRLLGEVAKGRGDGDWSGLVRGVREAAGLGAEPKG